MHHTYNNFAIVIPARYKSTRFPGKPLVEIRGKSMIERVWERCFNAVGKDKVYIATDDERISSHCSKFTKNIIMTSENCLTGTDRVAEAANKLGLEYVVNVQGDEPLINPSDIVKIIKAYNNSTKDCVINAMCEIKNEDEFYSVTVPKVVTALNGNLLYMSRSPIPGNKNNEFRKAWKQVCIYVFPTKILKEFASLNRKTTFENEEDIEILRILELGHCVKMVPVEYATIAVDVPEDLRKIEKAIDEAEE